MKRRDALMIGGLGGFLALPSRGFADGIATARESVNCILIWLDGGPSHLETFDLKPDASAEVRGPLTPIATSVPGIEISECLPLMAKQMDRWAIVRSLTSPLGEHNLGAHYVLTGYQPSPVLEYPSFTSIASLQRRGAADLPNNIAIPHYRVGGQGFTGAGFLSADARPFALNADPADPQFRGPSVIVDGAMSIDRLERRREFASGLRKAQAGSAGMQVDVQLPASVDQAFQLLTSPRTRKAFDLTAEPDTVRQRYGDRTIGQACLLARRLVEFGVSYVTVNFTGWDTHANLYTSLKEGFTGAKQPVGLIPLLDRAVSALSDDLQDRGLLQNTVILIAGEFGRTPRVNAQGGRDHWPRAFSVALAGGGVIGGQVIGASDRNGEVPKDAPVTPSDLVRSVYELLGIPPETELQTADGRPVRISPDSAKSIPGLR
ncbi:MAG: DUF1501 domain-containing protein [Planctomycetaceae bacterium]|nr:DUF1501 domain-containing protein [Planctomycetaceae bacterium]